MTAWALDCGVFLAVLLLLLGGIGIVARHGGKGCAIIVAVVAVVAAGVGWRYHQAERLALELARDFEAVIPELEANVSMAGLATAPAPCVRGKLLLIEGRETHRWQLRLPERLRARKPAEVETVGRLACKEVKVGVYRRSFQRGGQDAVRHTCEVELVDLVARHRYAPVSLQGSVPPNSPGFLGRTQGSIPKGEVLEYLQGLPACGPVEEVASVVAGDGSSAPSAQAPVVSGLSVVETGPDGRDKTAHFRVSDPDGDLDLLAEQRIRYSLACAAIGNQTSTAAAAWEREFGRVRVRIEAPGLESAGECTLRLTVRDEAWNVSAPAETVVIFR